MLRGAQFRAVMSDLASRRHLDAYVAIVLGLALAVLGLVGTVGIETVAAGILVALTAVVWTGLAIRHQMTWLAHAIERRERTGGLLRFADFPNATIRPQLRAASEIFLSGLTFYRFFPLFSADIEHAVRAGAKLKVLAIHEEGAAFKMSRLRSPTETSEETERHRIRATTDFLADLRGRVPNADIELRQIPYLAPYALMIIRSADPQIPAYYHARLLPFRSSTMRAPTIVPQADDQEWVQFIETQFSSLWEASTEVDLAERRKTPRQEPSNRPLQAGRPLAGG